MGSRNALPLALSGVAGLLGVLVAHAVQRVDEARTDPEGGLTPREEEIAIELRMKDPLYRRIDEQTWENRVKPEFYREAVKRTRHTTGNPAPSARDVRDWVRKHPLEADRLVSEIGERHAPKSRE